MSVRMTNCGRLGWVSDVEGYRYQPTHPETGKPWPEMPEQVLRAWEELRKLSGGDAFNRLTVVRRLETLAADPWDGLVSSSSELTAKMRRDVGMKR